MWCFRVFLEEAAVLKEFIGIEIAEPVKFFSNGDGARCHLGCNAIRDKLRPRSPMGNTFVVNVGRPMEGFSNEMVTAIGVPGAGNMVVIISPGDGEFVMGSIHSTLTFVCGGNSCSVSYLCRHDYNTVICQRVTNREEFLLVGGGHDTG